MKLNPQKIIRKPVGLTGLFSLIIFAIMLCTAVITFLGTFLLILSDNLDTRSYLLFLFLIEAVSIIAGTFAAAVICKRLIKPLHSIIEATEWITAGDFSTRLHLDHIREFVLLGEKFNCMAQELGSVEVLRNDFVNHFSHEFNTPINSIRGFAVLLKQGNLPPAEQELYLDRIITGADRLSTLAVNVLNLSKIEQQTILLHKSSINITEQIRRVIVMLSPRWEPKEIDFDFNCHEHYLKGNEEFLEHLWSNLLDNAIKYSPQGSIISISMQENPEALTIVLTDHGKGITEEALPHIFEKFYRSKSSQTVPGTGLGLTIAHKVVSLHNGTITVQSTPGKGTSFAVTFPKQ